jgi:hypothetical protein
LLDTINNWRCSFCMTKYSFKDKLEILLGYKEEKLLKANIQKKVL